MHLSRFMTMPIWAMTRIRRVPPRRQKWPFLPQEGASVLHLLAAAADDGHFVALVARRAEVVEGEGQLRVAADQVRRLEEEPGARVVDAAAAAGRLRPRDV